MTKTNIGFIRTASEPVDSWGKASDRRGTGGGGAHTQLAIQFVADHPIGTVLSVETFDRWVFDHGMIDTLPPEGASKKSDAWKANLQRRHECKNTLNAASAHPRMRESGSSPFAIMSVGGVFEVMAPHVAASKADLPRKMQSLIGTKRKQLAYLMQSEDFALLPDHERGRAEANYDDINDFAEDITTRVERISRNQAKLEHRIRMAIDAGKVTPTNGGLRQLLAPHEESNEEESSE